MLVPLQEKRTEQASQLLSTADSAASLRLLVTAKLVTLGYQGFGDSEAWSVFVYGRGWYDQLRFGGCSQHHHTALFFLCIEGKLRPREVTQWELILSKVDSALILLPDRRLIVQKGETEALSGVEHPAFPLLVQCLVNLSQAIWYPKKTF